MLATDVDAGTEAASPGLIALFLMWGGAVFCGLALKAPMQGAPLIVDAVLIIVAVALIAVTIFFCEIGPRTLLTGYGLWPSPAARIRPDTVATHIGIGVVVAIAAWLITTYVTTPLFPRPVGLVDDRADGYSSAHPFTGALGQFVENGLSEELVFRSPVVIWAVMVMPTLTHRGLRWSSGLAVVALTSVVFAASHSEYGMWNMSSAFVSGLLFGTAALLTRSLWPAILGHTAYNTAALVL